MTRSRIGRYDLLRPLAKGGMGEVFLAEHTGLAGFAKRVALKRIRAELANDPEYVRLFLNEARLGSFLNHPNIVHIFDVGHDELCLWLVMEYVDGVDLKRLARRAHRMGSPLSPVTIAAIAIEVLSALDEAHQGGPFRGAPIIHRDVSPENILIARSGAVKVLDFGLAKRVPQQAQVPSMEGRHIFGKVRYMPPEQLKGELIDVRADLFALGAVMYEVLTGTLPFGDGDANRVLHQIRLGHPPSPTAGTARALDAIVLGALAPNPVDRPESALSMRAALVDYVEGRARFMPSEGLRSMLHARPGAHAKIRTDASGEESGDATGRWSWSPREGETGHESKTGRQGDTGRPSERGCDSAFTEIALAAIERCGKCGGRFRAYFLDGLILERCGSCHGVWLDQAEVARLVGHISARADGSNAPELVDAPELADAPEIVDAPELVDAGAFADAPEFPEGPHFAGVRDLVNAHNVANARDVVPGSDGPAPRFEPAPLDRIVGSCPVCRVGLAHHEVPGQPAMFERCPHCLGVWLDRGEIELLRDPRIATWFRALSSRAEG